MVVVVVVVLVLVKVVIVVVLFLLLSSNPTTTPGRKKERPTRPTTADGQGDIQINSERETVRKKKRKETLNTKPRRLKKPQKIQKNHKT